MSYASGGQLELFVEPTAQSSNFTEPEEVPAVRPVSVNAGVRRVLPLPVFLLGLVCLISVVHAVPENQSEETSSYSLASLQNAAYGLSVSPREFAVAINQMTMQLDWDSMYVVIKWCFTVLCIAGSFFFGRWSSEQSKPANRTDEGPATRVELTVTPNTVGSDDNTGPGDGELTYSANSMPTRCPLNDRPRVWI